MEFGHCACETACGIQGVSERQVYGCREIARATVVARSCSINNRERTAGEEIGRVCNAIDGVIRSVGERCSPYARECTGARYRPGVAYKHSPKSRPTEISP